ncbi:hypothetical protein O9G_000020 [Rozella allomycis CSF55]|uniref:Uncharacterized protein n=1 Tax=Rozella allomycis (strain CSF55) TaxID=988480 RepID=A0A075ANR9_ROZAC|nr:hypothetical protein O9G_000020 [Rozella allomycis CSF55]|eukprot:EPZ31544.1 hypothetical protein O9G_000020 [Rozella allomycis CSF55]
MYDVRSGSMIISFTSLHLKPTEVCREEQLSQLFDKVTRVYYRLLAVSMYDVRSGSMIISFTSLHLKPTEVCREEQLSQLFDKVTRG